MDSDQFFECNVCPIEGDDNRQMCSDVGWVRREGLLPGKKMAKRIALTKEVRHHGIQEFRYGVSDIAHQVYNPIRTLMLQRSDNVELLIG